PCGLLLAVRRSVDHHELRARIRRLIASGDLPTLSPLASGTVSAPGGIRRISIERPLPDLCSICGEANPTVAYTYAKGGLVLLHAACDPRGAQEPEADPGPPTPTGPPLKPLASFTSNVANVEMNHPSTC